MFLTDPGMIPISNAPDLVWLDGPLIWHDPVRGTVTVPLGFISDDASTPKFLDWVPFLDRQGLSRRPGLLHDAAYNLGREKGKDWCDALLRDACLAEGMTLWQAGIYFKGVQWFGASSWAKDAHHDTFGQVTCGNFIDEMHFDAWKASGGSIYSV